jgi:hypothetical protein
MGKYHWKTLPCFSFPGYLNEFFEGRICENSTEACLFWLKSLLLFFKETQVKTFIRNSLKITSLIMCCYRTHKSGLKVIKSFSIVEIKFFQEIRCKALLMKMFQHFGVYENFSLTFFCQSLIILYKSELCKFPMFYQPVAKIIIKV